MTEPASHAGFRDLARQALSRRTGIPAKTDWEVFLHGFASTNQLGGERERDIYECLLRTFPTPESVIDKDLRTLRNESGCQSLISPVNSADWMKRNAENWDNIRPLLRCRTRAEQDAIRNFIEDPQNQNKRLVKEFVGANYKGSDMTLLWGGCEVPVVDKQLIRYLAPTMLGTDWDSYIRDQLSERKSSGRKLKLGRRFSADQGQDIQAADIDVDDPTHRYAEEEAIVGKIQSTVGRYGAWRDLAYQMADAEGLPANIWHVATWLEYRIGGDPDSARANPRTLAQGREFAGRTYAPSETPSAVTDDQMRYLNAEVNDRISYGLRNETVERGRGPAYILSWSNASAEWSVFARREKVGTTVRLDANQILGYGNQADLDEAAPLLNPLPLYTGSFEYREQGKQDPSAFVGFETPFGFDDAITVMWQDWVQYKINDTPVVVRRVDTKPGTKVNPRYKGATAPKELQIDFRLRASNRKDMQKIDFLLERLREDNPNMTVKVNVKTNGQTARRNLPSWQDRPYRVVPSAEFGVFYTPEEHDPMIQKYGFWEVDLYEESDSPYVDAYFHEGTEVNDEGELLDEETYMCEDIGKAEFTSGETSLAEVVWDIDDVRVGISYGPWTSRLGEHIDHAAYVDISRYGGAPLGPEIFQPGGPIAKITNLLDGIHRANPNIRIVATATTDVEGRGDIRARIYERYGWRRIGVTDVSGSVDIELPHPNQRSSGSASAFTGIEEYASDIMELV